jgi:hypothetical protein
LVISDWSHVHRISIPLYSRSRGTTSCIAGRENDNPQHSNTIRGSGHYEDELVKVNGQWFFSKRKIYNEGSAKWQYKGGVNPAW